MGLFIYWIQLGSTDSLLDSANMTLACGCRAGHTANL